jgi:outer membrane protein
MNSRIIAASLLLLSLDASAADLLSLYQQAAQHDPQILAARANREASKESEPLARSTLLPNLSASGKLDYSDQDVNKPTSYSGSYASNSLGLSLVQPLFRKDRLIGLEQAKDQVKQADADYAVAEHGLIIRLAQAYFGVLSAQETLTFTLAEKKAIARQLDQAKERFEVGLVAITDVHEAQARYDESKANEISAYNAVDNALEVLREIVSEAPNKLDDLKVDLPLVPPDPANIDDWAQTAQQHNPEIMSSRLGVEIARKNIDVKRAGHYPTLDLVGTLSRARSNATVGTDADSGTIGLQLAVPIYSGGGVNSATRQATYQFQAAQEGLDQKRRAVARQVRDAYRGIQASISRVAALKATVRSAMSALEATQAGFEAGTRTLVEVLNSQSALFKARRDYAQSRYDYVVNTLSLLQAAGTLSEEDVQRVDAWLQATQKQS